MLLVLDFVIVVTIELGRLRFLKTRDADSSAVARMFLGCKPAFESKRNQKWSHFKNKQKESQFMIPYVEELTQP